MANKQEYRARAQRLLNGDFHNSDLTVLFLYLRGESFGRESVRDLGNMLGHSDARTQGVTVKRVQAMYTVMLFQSPKIAGYPNWALDTKNLPPNIVDVMCSTLSLMSDDTPDSEFNRLQTSLKRFERRLIINQDGSLNLVESHQLKKDISLVKKLTGFIISKGGYTPPMLYGDFEYVMLKHKFLEGDQVYSLRQRCPWLTLFAISSMHGVLFHLPDGNLAEAKAGWSDRDGIKRLCVTVSFSVPYKTSNLTFSMTIFQTDLILSDWISQNDEELSLGVWDFPIELTDQLLLRRLV